MFLPPPLPSPFFLICLSRLKGQGKHGSSTRREDAPPREASIGRGASRAADPLSFMIHGDRHRGLLSSPLLRALRDTAGLREGVQGGHPSAVLSSESEDKQAPAGKKKKKTQSAGPSRLREHRSRCVSWRANGSAQRWIIGIAASGRVPFWRESTGHRFETRRKPRSPLTPPPLGVQPLSLSGEGGQRHV